MPKDVNKVIFIGNVGKDPEIRVLPSGMTVANFSLATNESVKDQMGGYHDRTEWHNIKVLDRRAEVVRDYVRKGTRLYIEGKQQTRSWDDKESGEKKYRTEVLVFDLILLSWPDGTTNGNSTSSRHNSNGNQRYASRVEHSGREDYANVGAADDDLDIPF